MLLRRHCLIRHNITPTPDARLMPAFSFADAADAAAATPAHCHFADFLQRRRLSYRCRMPLIADTPFRR
jgi:hypothetical protein